MFCISCGSEKCGLESLSLYYENEGGAESWVCLGCVLRCGVVSLVPPEAVDEALSNLADLSSMLGQYKLAISTYSEAARDGMTPYVSNAIAHNYGKIGDVFNELRMYQETLRICPADSIANENVRVILKNVSNPPDQSSLKQPADPDRH